MHHVVAPVQVFRVQETHQAHGGGGGRTVQSTSWDLAMHGGAPPTSPSRQGPPLSILTESRWILVILSLRIPLSGELKSNPEGVLPPS